MSKEAKDIKVNDVLSEACVLKEDEIECLSLVALGYTNEQIAQIVFTSVATVKIKIKSILKAFSAVDRTHAVTLGFLHQILNVSVINSIMAKRNLKHRRVERLS